MAENARRKIKMIALDLDGTTLRDDKTLTERTAEAIRRADSSMICMVVATGRPLSAVPAELLTMGSISYFICSNGANIYDRNGKNIYGKRLPAEAVEEAVEIVRKSGYMFESFTGGKAYIGRDEYDRMKEQGCDYRTSSYVLKTRIPVDDIFDFTLEHKDDIENLNVFFSDQEKKRAFLPKLETIKNVTLTSSFTSNYELGGEGVSKAAALSFLMDLKHIGKDELMAAGDSPNDISMLKLAGTAVAVENAVDEVKDAAGIIVPSNLHDGVAIAIEKFLQV